MEIPAVVVLLLCLHFVSKSLEAADFAEVFHCCFEDHRMVGVGRNL